MNDGKGDGGNDGEVPGAMNDAEVAGDLFPPDLASASDAHIKGTELTVDYGNGCSSATGRRVVVTSCEPGSIRGA